MNKVLILAFLGAVTGSAAFASSTVLISFNTLPGTTGNGTTNSQGGTYNGKVGVTIAGIPSEYLVCDDFENTTYVPSQVDFSVSTVSSLSGVDFKSGFATISGITLSQTQAYDTAAVLLTELEALPVSGNSQAITDYQYAIWSLMQPNGASDGYRDNPLDSNATSDLNAAFAAMQANSYAIQADERALVIYTPTQAFSSNQEFLGLNTPTPTPEPPAWVCLSSLAIGLQIGYAFACRAGWTAKFTS